MRLALTMCCGWSSTPPRSVLAAGNRGAARAAIRGLPAGERLTAEEIRLELARALYARGRIGKVTATEIAGVDFFTFQRVLGERGVPLYTQQMLTSDL